MRLTLKEWAEANFATPPCSHTVRAWIKAGRIHPTPEKIGRGFYFDPSAAYTDRKPSLVSRIHADEKESRAV